ncbi:MAG: hypothetical protein IJ560_01400 [Alphaproteobacteria bacterium]|nr:hypothetical protein [Alphaproteobacteria bacterium]
MITPDLTLSMDDKIYLAVAKNTNNKTAFVYTLACLRQGATLSYDGIATHEIHAFNDKRRAQMYYDAVKQIVAINKSDNNKEIFFEINQNMIQRFNERTK